MTPSARVAPENRRVAASVSSASPRRSLRFEVQSVHTGVHMMWTTRLVRFCARGARPIHRGKMRAPDPAGGAGSVGRRFRAVQHRQIPACGQSAGRRRSSETLVFQGVPSHDVAPWGPERCSPEATWRLPYVSRGVPTFRVTPCAATRSCVRRERCRSPWSWCLSQRARPPGSNPPGHFDIAAIPPYSSDRTEEAPSLAGFALHETHLPTKRAPSQAQARLPRPHADAARARHPQAPA